MGKTRVPDELEGCSLSGTMSANPSTIVHGGAAITLRWSAAAEGSCPPIEWLIYPGWVVVPPKGELVVRAYSDTTYYLIATMDKRTWSRGIAEASVERIYKPPKGDTESIDADRQADGFEDFAASLADEGPVEAKCRILDKLHDDFAPLRPVLDPDGLRYVCTYGHTTAVLKERGPNE